MQFGFIGALDEVTSYVTQGDADPFKSKTAALDSSAAALQEQTQCDHRYRETSVVNSVKDGFPPFSSQVWIAARELLKASCAAPMVSNSVQRWYQ
jgi:hypothetical protein